MPRNTPAPRAFHVMNSHNERTFRMDKPPVGPAQLADLDQSIAKITAVLGSYLRLADRLLARHGYEPAVAALHGELKKQQNPAALSALAAVAIAQLASRDNRRPPGTTNAR